MAHFSFSQRKGLSAALVLPLALVLAVPGHAQIEEVVVTATKREENVQDVAVAVTVLDGETISSAFATGFEDLQALVPSASFRKGNTTRNSTVTVRGIGTISFSTAAEASGTRRMALSLQWRPGTIPFSSPSLSTGAAT